MPGWLNLLVARVGGEVFLLESGATARGLLTRCRDMQRGISGVSLIRQLPWDQSRGTGAKRRDQSQGGRPTHILFENTAYPIGEAPSMSGSQPGEGRWIDLRDDMPGVSRQHCSVQRENGQCVVRDSQPLWFVSEWPS